MRDRKLNFRFHDPNPEAETVDYILKLFLEADKEKVEAAVQQSASGFEEPREEEAETMELSM